MTLYSIFTQKGNLKMYTHVNEDRIFLFWKPFSPFSWRGFSKEKNSDLVKSP